MTCPRRGCSSSYCMETRSTQLHKFFQAVYPRAHDLSSTTLLLILLHGDHADARDAVIRAHRACAATCSYRLKSPHAETKLASRIIVRPTSRSESQRILWHVDALHNTDPVWPISFIRTQCASVRMTRPRRGCSSFFFHRDAAYQTG